MRSEFDCISVPAGADIFHQGDSGTRAYLIEEGEVRIWVADESGHRQLAVLGAAEIFGEMAIIDGGARSASATATADCRLFEIDPESLSRRLTGADPVLRMLLNVLLERLRSTLPPANTDRSAATAIAIGCETSRVKEQALLEMRLEREIERAILSGEFVLHFQPIVDLASGEIGGYESLVRWNHPQRGLLPPSCFIPLAETSRLICGITRWCLDAAIAAMPALVEASGTRHGPRADETFLTVNVSGHDLADRSFPDYLEALASRIRPLKGHVKIEITETSLMSEPELARQTLRRCRDLGLGVAIDDFGTGYSSLSYLSSLPITALKIDRSFVQALPGQGSGRNIVRTIIKLADELGIPAVCEGIEHRHEAELLAAMGCRYGQGYLFAKPMPLDETCRLARSWRPCEDGLV